MSDSDDVYDLKYEGFRSYDEMINILKNRPNNKIMISEDASSRNGNESWYGTSSYSEATKMLAEGYKDVIKTLKKNVEIQNKLNAKYLSEVERPMPRNAVVGYIPNVPNAIRNIPQSMITVDKKPMKRKTIHIIYGVTGSCQKDTEYFIKAGSSLLSAIDIIERSSIQTKLDVAFFCGTESNELALTSVPVKTYGERYSLQKISFPIAHPSMFRRFGFKWLETNNVITKNGFSCGYGSPPETEKVERTISHMLGSGTYYLDTTWIQNNECSVEKILNKLEVI